MEKISKQIQKIQEALESMNRRFDSVDKRFDSMDGRINTVEVTTNQIMDFLKENMLMRQEAYEIFATKDELKATENRLMTAIDGNTKRLIDFEAEMAASRLRAERHEKRTSVIEKKLGITPAI